MGLCLRATLGHRARGEGGVAPLRYCREAPSGGHYECTNSVVLVDGTMAGDTPGRECPREDGIWRPVCLWVAAMLDCRVLGKRCPPLMLPEGPFWWCPLGGPPRWVLRTLLAQMTRLSPLFHDALGPLEHSVLDHAGPVGQRVAVGPVGPDETLLGLDPLEHSGLDHADLAGQHAAVGPVCHLTVTLLDRLARMLQGALLRSFKFWIR